MKMWTRSEVAQELLKLAAYAARPGVLVTFDTAWADVHLDRASCAQHIEEWAKGFELPDGMLGAFYHCQRIGDALAVIVEAMDAQGRLVS